MKPMKAAILSVSGPVLTEAERGMLSEFQPWGVILMGRSVRSPGQVRRLVDAIWGAMERPCMVFTDQEGGRVARLKSPEWPQFPPARAYADLYATDPEKGLEASFLGHRLMAAELSEIGIHADCSPVCDLSIPGAHDIIGDRAFGSDGETISNLTRAAMDGLHSGGVASVIKHIPGHGRAKADSHEELPKVSEPLKKLEADFVPFRALNDAPMAMTAHILYDAIDPGAPATQSVKLISEVIRGSIGFGGLLMTDDLGMAALEGSLTERAERSISAGCDVILHCSGFLTDAGEILSEMKEVAEAAPELSGMALQRAQAAESATTNRIDPRFDAASAREAFEALLSKPMEAVA